MASPTPLQGLELIDCAKANAEQGTEVAAELCGYGGDLNSFHQKLQQACEDIGVSFHTISDLVTDQQAIIRDRGIEVAPDTPSEL